MHAKLFVRTRKLRLPAIVLAFAVVGFGVVAGCTSAPQESGGANPTTELSKDINVAASNPPAWNNSTTSGYG